MRKVELRMNELEKYNVIKNLVDNKGNKNKASLKLGLSRRQIDRLVDKYKESGKSAFIHGNRTKKPVNALDKSLSEDIILHYQHKYYDCNFNHFKDLLVRKENINVSYNYIYKVLTNNDIYSPRIRKVTKKKLKKIELAKMKENQNLNSEDLDGMANHIIDIEDTHPRQEKPKYFGEIIEMDGSIHLWFGSKKVCLHLAIDGCTKTIVGGYFDYQETLFGYYNVYKQILEKYGIPYKFKTDNRTIFNYESLNKAKRASHLDVLTQFGYACKILGVDLETSSVPQAKGTIERANGTFQDRLVQELKIEGISTIEKANDYLLNTFIPNFNNKFALNYKGFQSVFETAPDPNKINYTLAILTTRKIDNGNAIKYYGKYYQPYENNKLVCFKPRTECLVVKAFDNTLLVTINEQVYQLKELETHKKASTAFNEEKPSNKERKQYVPPMTHPWKAASFKKQMQKAHTKRVYA